MYCKECGAEIDDGKFCKECGTKIDSTNQEHSEIFNKITGTPIIKDTTIKKIPQNPNQTAINVGWIGLILFVPLTFVMGYTLLLKKIKKLKKMDGGCLGFL